MNFKYWFLYWFGDKFIVNKISKIIKKHHKNGLEINTIKYNAQRYLNKNLVSTCRSDILIMREIIRKHNVYRVKIILYYPNNIIRNKQFYLK